MGATEAHADVPIPDGLRFVRYRCRTVVKGEKVSASFLYNGTRSLFEQAGFTYERPKGKNHCVMRATIAPSREDG
ncbi:MAG TPA: hypothetical protein VMP13_06400 [Acidimicrobiia bacterium]|nr:hypothetical protein [Acidimicrobiia bacterium]